MGAGAVLACRGELRGSCSARKPTVKPQLAPTPAQTTGLTAKMSELKRTHLGMLKCENALTILCQPPLGPRALEG